MIEQSIFTNLLNNEEYYRTVIPHLQKEYFLESHQQRLYSYIKFFSDKYNKRPNVSALKILLSKDTALDDGTYTSIERDIDILEKSQPDLSQLKFMIDETEAFCKQRAVFNALRKSLEIKENSDLSPDKRNKKLQDVGIIPDLLRDALSICFDSSVGHNYLEDWEKRYDSYHDKETKIPFDIDILNRVTKGGAEYKTLNCLVGGSGTGKSLGLVHLAAGYITKGYDVLYITLEMSEEAISKRVDANLLGISLDDLENIPKGMYKNKIETIKDKIVGRLYVKQFPTGAGHCGHFRALLSELEMKQSFKPKIIIVDYLGICASTRMGFGGENSYGHLKAIAEELRGLAIETNTCVWSGAQTTRGQWDKSDIDMSDVAECMAGDSVIETIGGFKVIKDIKVGDLVKSYDGFRPVIQVHHPKKSKAYRIRTKSGKEIIVSEYHKFPTANGRMSISGGLAVGSKLCSVGISK